MSDAWLDQEALLDAVALANAAVRVERKPEGLLLFVPIRRRAWMAPLRLILPLRDERGFALDALGADVFLACDGQRRVEQIVEGFAERHGLRFHEARLSVMHFLRALCQRNLVVLSLPRTPEAAASDRQASP